MKFDLLGRARVDEVSCSDGQVVEDREPRPVRVERVVCPCIKDEQE